MKYRFSIHRWPALIASLACLALSACTGVDVSCGRDAGLTMPVTMRGPAILMPVYVNGVPQVFLVDTGGARSVIERRSALALGLMHKVGHEMMRDVSGARVLDTVTTDTFRMGAVSVSNQSFVVSDGLPFDGVIGLDILSAYDLDIDEPHGRLQLHKAGLCKGDRPDLGGAMVEMEAIRGIKTGIGAMQKTSPFLLVAAQLDGKYSLAMLDTGALNGSVVAQRFADASGTDSGQLAGDLQVSARGLGPSTTLTVHRFTKLIVGGEVFNQPQLMVTADPGTRFPLILGEDYFRTHRVWLNFAADRVFSAPVSLQNSPGS